MLLVELQQLLGSFYDVPAQHDVRDFLVTDRAYASALGGTQSDEQLFVAQVGDEVGVSLYLDAAVLQRLAGANPMVSLNQANLADYLTAVEGVSHFVCLAWNATFDKPVSLLELELQGEIDKFVSSAWLLSRQAEGRYPRELHHVLFNRTRVDDALAGNRAGMYRAASRYASCYCRKVAQRFSDDAMAAGAGIWSDLRRFYRLSLMHKLAHIERSA